MKRACLTVLAALFGLAVLIGLRPAGSATAEGSVGFLEVCKAADGEGVSGTFTFDVNGQSVRVPAGACSAPLQLQAGDVTITEAPAPGISVVAVETIPADRLVRADLPARTATVRVVAGDASTQTIATFGNRFTSGVLKVCKVAGSGVTEGRGFTFDVDGSALTVPAGPAPDGFCTVAGSFPAGTEVTVTEAVPRGMEVSSIDVTPLDRLAGALSPISAQVAVSIGPGTTEVRFTNRQAPSVAPPSPTTTTTAPPSVAPPTSAPTTATTTVRRRRSRRSSAWTILLIVGLRRPS